MYLAQVSPTTSIIFCWTNSRCHIATGELQSQNYVTGTPENNSGDHEKSATLSVIVTECTRLLEDVTKYMYNTRAAGAQFH
jgi:hypothetical protein